MFCIFESGNKLNFAIIPKNTDQNMTRDPCRTIVILMNVSISEKSKSIAIAEPRLKTHSCNTHAQFPNSTHVVKISKMANVSSGGSLEIKTFFYQSILNCNGDPEGLKRAFIESPGLDNDKKSIIEQSFRDVIMDSAKDSTSSSVVIMSDLLLLSIKCAEEEICYHSVPFLILSDAFDMITLDRCEDLFSLVEEQVWTWMKPAFFGSGKILLLRMCNDLLRRLSYSQNTVFCGRIQLFLARLFPLSEKSALNLMSHFNLENITSFKKVPKPATETPKEEQESEEGEEMEVEPIIDSNTLASEMPVDYNLYEKLWSVQDFFRNPTLCFNNDRWKNFTQQTQEVLQVFSSFKLEYVETKRDRRPVRPDKQEMDTTPSLTTFENSHYFNKYLTSEKLINLQLSDVHFRRHILIQIMIIFQYLLGDVKFKNQSQNLSDSQALWIEDTKKKVVKLLEETPPNGLQFCEYILHALKREENWIKWKNEGCPSYEKQQGDGAIEEKKKRARVGDSLLEKCKEGEKDLGCEELSRLWNLCPDNLDACSSSERIFVPPLDIFLDDAIEEAKDKTMPREKKTIANSNFAWQTLRLLSRESPHFFPYSSQAQIRPLDEYLETVILATAKDLSSENRNNND